MQRVYTTRGFTLLEVLIAILVFSMGLLGAASLLVLSVRTNHSAYLRTQASFLAEGMADRIRTNLGWAESYNGDYDEDTVGDGDCPSSVCSPANLVTRDTQIWSQQLVDFLPAATASIDCDDTGASAAHRGSQPFNGLCTIVINWTEADLSRTGGTPATQTFAWVFQP